MKLKEIKKKIDEEGYVQAIILFEVIGSPKEYVQRAISNHISKLKAEKNVEVLSEALEEPEEQENKLWSTFAEIEVLVKGLEKLTWICFEFMPASVEIMAPESLRFKARELTNWLNDLLAKNHEIGIVSQQIGQQNKMMLQSINALIRNSILICLDSNINIVDDIAKKIGVAKKDLEPVFEAMIKENRIEKKGKKYIRK